MSVKRTLSPLLDAIAVHAQDTPDKTAVITLSGDKITYKSLLDHICQAATYLQIKGIGKDDRIMISAQKEVEFIYFYFASHMIGAINVVVDAKNNAAHLEYISSVVEPSLSIGVDIRDVPTVKFQDLDLSDFECSWRGHGCSLQDVADIMFTSGTTGKPKGVLLTHSNIFSSACNINGFVGNTADDIELLGLPVCHSFGLGRMRCCLLMGATLVLHNGFANLKSVFETFTKYHVTGFGMVPAIWAYIKRFSGSRIGRFASQIKYIEIGSAAMPTDDKRMLLDLFPDARICMHYGLTEASRAVFMEFHDFSDKLDAVGFPVNENVSLKVIDEHGLDVSTGIEGEVCVKGNMVTRSYFNVSDNAGAFTSDGYFRTGDWGWLDSSGCLYLIARKKEMINVGGKKVSPVEIEEALHSLGVGESMCVAMKDPDGILGEVPKVLLVRGTFSKGIEEIRRGLTSLLESYKMPREIEIVDSIPKTANGKKIRT